MAGNRCEQCQKFVSLELGEPEVDSENIDTDGQIEVSITLTRNCADCGSEMKSYTYELEATAEIEGHKGEGHTLELELDTPEADEGGGGRYAKNMISVEVGATVRCSCQDKDADLLWSDTLTDSAAASDFEDY